jgi:DNA-directed RNA polymerase sigma subunit (sigma70/sigma32)
MIPREQWHTVLTELELQVINLMWEPDNKKKTCRQVAQELCMTAEEVRDIEDSATYKLLPPHLQKYIDDVGKQSHSKELIKASKEYQKHRLN